MMYITYKALNNIISEILLVSSFRQLSDFQVMVDCDGTEIIDPEHKLRLEAIDSISRYRLDKQKIFIDNRRNKNIPYNFIPLSEVIKLSKPLLKPSFKYPGNIGYAQIENSPTVAVDISKEDRCIVQKLLFDIIGTHHWGVCKLFNERAGADYNDTNKNSIQQLI